MLVSGSKFRSLAESDDLSWLAYLTVSGSSTGRAVFGFSGEGKTMCFTFDDGRIFDPEDRFFAGYRAGVTTDMISGNISGTKYNYYYGGRPYCFDGVKPDFKVQNFFAQTTGCSLNTEMWVYGDPFGFDIGYQTGFIVSGALTGRLTSLDSNYKFKIFSGDVIDSSGSFSLSGFDAGNRNDATITLSTTGNISGTTEFATYPVRVILQTSFGTVDRSFGSVALPKSPINVNLSLVDLAGLGEELSGFNERIAEHDLSYIITETHSATEVTGAQAKPLRISLQYSGGRTGDFYQVSGIEVTSPGSDYTSAPTPLFFGHSHSKNTSYYHIDASGESLMSFSVAGVDMTHLGGSYTSNAEVIFVGGGGVGAVISGLTGNPNEPSVSGKITGIKLINAGSGYSGAPSLTFDLPGGLSGETASGAVTLKSGFLTGIKLTHSGIYHLNEPYLSGILGGNGSGAGASITTKKYTKTFTGLWDLKTGYSMDSLSSYRTENKISGHRLDNKVPVYETFGYYWKDLRNACEKNEGPVHLSYSFMNSGTEVFDVYNYTGTVTDTLQDHYWSDRGYLVDGNPITTTSEFTGQIGEAFQEWKELLENAFTGVTVEFKNLGFEGASATTISSPWPAYDNGGLLTGAYYFYSRSAASGEAYNIGDFRIGMADHLAAPGWLAFGFYPMSYSKFFVSSETGAHMGDIIFDRKDAWMVGDDDSLVNLGFDIKHVAVHEIGHTLGLGHTDPDDLWSQESIMAPYGAVRQRFAGDFPAGLKGSAIDKAAIKRLYASGGYDDNWTGSGNGRQDDYSNLNNIYMNVDPVYITGANLKIVVEHDPYDLLEAGMTPDVFDVNYIDARNTLEPVSNAGGPRLWVPDPSFPEDLHVFAAEALCSEEISSTSCSSCNNPTGYIASECMKGIYQADGILYYNPPCPDAGGGEACPRVKWGGSIYEADQSLCCPVLFSKYIDVFGVPVLATSGVSDVKVEHAASVLAEYIDNDKGGIPDNKSVINSMTNNKSVLLITESDAEYTGRIEPNSNLWNNSGFNTYSLYSSEIAAGGFDYSLKKTLHLITSEGYAKAYTGTFGLGSGTILADLMDVARGGHFKTIPPDNTYASGPANGRYPSGSWFHSVDTGCDYACQVNQYIYWGITTTAGVQSARCSDITGEWEPCTKTGMQQVDTGLYSLLASEVYSFPTIAPSGVYAGPTKHYKFENRYPDSQKVSATLQITGRQDVSISSIFTGVAGPEAIITGLTSGAEASTGFHAVLGQQFLQYSPMARRCCNINNKRLKMNLIPYTGELQ